MPQAKRKRVKHRAIIKSILTLLHSLLKHHSEKQEDDASIRCKCCKREIKVEEGDVAYIRLDDLSIFCSDCVKTKKLGRVVKRRRVNDNKNYTRRDSR